MATRNAIVDILTNVLATLVYGGMAVLAGYFVYLKFTAVPEVPVRSQSKAWESALTAVYPVGKPFQVNGCTVSLHRVATNAPEISDMTLATAQCVGTTVVTTKQACGKDCVNTSAKIIPSPETQKTAG